MALWIKANGVALTVSPRNGKHFILAELQRYVGGYIEALDLQNGSIMWLNEEGKLNGLPYNLVADFIAHQHTGIATDDHVVGDVLIATTAETGDDEEEDED